MSRFKKYNAPNVEGRGFLVEVFVLTVWGRGFRVKGSGFEIFVKEETRAGCGQVLSHEWAPPSSLDSARTRDAMPTRFWPPWFLRLWCTYISKSSAPFTVVLLNDDAASVQALNDGRSPKGLQLTLPDQRLRFADNALLSELALASTAATAATKLSTSGVSLIWDWRGPEKSENNLWQDLKRPRIDQGPEKGPPKPSKTKDNNEHKKQTKPFKTVTGRDRDGIEKRNDKKPWFLSEFLWPVIGLRTRAGEIKLCCFVYRYSLISRVLRRKTTVERPETPIWSSMHLFVWNDSRSQRLPNLREITHQVVLVPHFC